MTSGRRWWWRPTSGLDDRAGRREHTAAHGELSVVRRHGFYDGLLFHRSVCTDGPRWTPASVRPAGRWVPARDGELVLVDPTRPPVVKETETSLSNGVLYSVALALSSSDTDSGTTQFFINLDEDNDFLDDRASRFRRGGRGQDTWIR